MHLCQRFFQSSKHFSNSIFGIAFSCFSDALLMSSMAVKRRPFKVLFIFGNRKSHTEPYLVNMEARASLLVERYIFIFRRYRIIQIAMSRHFLNTFFFKYTFLNKHREFVCVIIHTTKDNLKLYIFTLRRVRRRYPALGQPLPWAISFFFYMKRKYIFIALCILLYF